MNTTQEKAFFHLTGKHDFTGIGVESMQALVEDYPYFAPAHFFLNLFFTQNIHSMAIPQTVTTNLYFTNPYWLQYQLQEGMKKSLEEIETVTEVANPVVSNINIPSVEDVKEIMRNIDNTPESISELTEKETKGNIPENKIAGILSEQLAAFKKPMEADAKLDIDAIAERLFTVDYFASQGIKIDLTNIPQDKLTTHLRKFTDWLKQMKQLEGTQLVAHINPEMEKAVVETAKISNETREILTDAMADVLVKQGQVEKAIQLYIKLSFINPEKSSYFASKIEQLKGI